MAAYLKLARNEFCWDNLPFISIIDKEDGERTINHWSVSPSGDYGKDCETGRHYARLLVRSLRLTDCASILPWIIEAMPRGKDRTGIEIGFWHAFANAVR